MVRVVMKQVAQRGGGYTILGDIQGRLDQALSNLMELWVFLFIAAGLDWMALRIPSNSNDSKEQHSRK